MPCSNESATQSINGRNSCAYIRIIIYHIKKIEIMKLHILNKNVGSIKITRYSNGYAEHVWSLLSALSRKAV